MTTRPSILRLYRIGFALVAVTAVVVGLRARYLTFRVRELEYQARFTIEGEKEGTRHRVEEALRKSGLHVKKDTVRLEYEKRCELYFYLDHTISDISFLKDLPRAVNLVSLELGGTKVVDLGPLHNDYSQDCKLEEIGLKETRVSDLTPLVGHPLRRIDISSTGVADISPLASMPLREVKANFTSVSDLTPLKGKPLTEVELTKTLVSDLSPLSGMRLETLAIAGTQVKDLSPLRGMPLTMLSVDMTQVKDLSPIKGMKLEALGIAFTPITNLEAVSGMSITGLGILGTDVTDLTPLKGMELFVLGFEPWKIESGIEVIRSMPTLKVISVGLGHECTYLRVADFWKTYDEGGFKRGAKKWKTREELIEIFTRVLEARSR